MSESQIEAIKALNQLLPEAGGLDVFGKLSAANLLSSLEQFKGKIRRLTPKSAFPVGEAINVSSIKNAVNEDALALWLATAIEIFECAAT